MPISTPLLRGLTAAAAAALPLALAAPSEAQTGISVSTSGSTVSVTTSSCSQQINGSWGNASLLSSGQANFSQGRQVALSGSSALQSAAWSNVSPGTYTVVVVCANGSTAGTQSVIVSAPSRPTISATATPSPSRGVMGGLGGGTKDYGTLTLIGGGALVAVGAGATVWVLRRRSKPYRL